MKKILIVYLGFLFGCSNAQTIEKDFPASFKIDISNPLDVNRESCMVVISPQLINKHTTKFNSKAFVVLEKSSEIPSQYNDEGSDRGIVFIIENIKPNETKEITIRFNSKGERLRNYTKRTQAELSHKVGGHWEKGEYIDGTFKNVSALRVPPEHKDHSWFIRYEGPGWESDKVGYRFYLDQRNATDVFGKKTPSMVLQNVGLDGFDSYHEMQPWGMDMMKVGKSLGIGSIGAIINGHVTRVEKTDSINCHIEKNGTVYSSIVTNYYGWKFGNDKHNLESHISIHGGSRLTHQRISIKSSYDSLCTGIVKDTAATLYTNSGDDTHWGYIATYGKQSLNNDNLGLAIFFNPKHVLKLSEDEYSNVLVLKPDNGVVDYYFMAAWQLETNGIQTQEKFIEYLRKTANEISFPLTTK